MLHKTPTLRRVTGLTCFCIQLCPMALPAQDHPRVWFSKMELPNLQAKAKAQPYAKLVQHIKQGIKDKEGYLDTASKVSYSDHAYLVRAYAELYVVENKNAQAKAAYQHIGQMLSDKVYNDPLSSGLGKAGALQSGVMAYDFCFNGWNQRQRRSVNKQLSEIMVEIAGSMGPHANYSLVSNWMGIRYSTVLLAGLALDTLKDFNEKFFAQYEYMATKALQHHLKLNTYRNGWNAESLGYQNYLWGFVGPALIALQRRYPEAESLQLEAYCPEALNSWKAAGIAGLSVPTRGDRKGIKPDLSDDNPWFSSRIFIWGLRLARDRDKPYLQWLLKYHLKHSYHSNTRMQHFFLLPFCQEELEPQNPGKAQWTRYQDPEQGVVIFRNRFQDKQDIVFLANATEKRMRGHSNHDSNTFRLLGLGNLWVTGPGRTGEVGGNTTVFPSLHPELQQPKNDEGKLLSYEFNASNGGFALMEGSSVETRAHLRKVQVDYAHPVHEGVFLVRDQSANGKLWRMCTPAFNTLTLDGNKAQVTAPNGSRLWITSFKGGDIQTQQLRYHGSTQRLAPPICIEDTCSPYIKNVDLPIEGDALVVLVLTKAGTTEPGIEWDAEAQTIQVDGKSYPTEWFSP